MRPTVRNIAKVLFDHKSGIAHPIRKLASYQSMMVTPEEIQLIIAHRRKEINP